MPSIALGTIALIFHFVTGAQYGYLRDELYFIACGMHPAWGYVDQPPLVPLLSLLELKLGGSLQALRFIPALGAAATVMTSCAIARRLGGGWFAEVIAGLAALLAPVILGMTSTFNTSSLEPLAWTLTAYLAMRAVLDNEPRWWYAAGATVGIAVNNKYGIVFFAIAIVVALALCKRDVFSTRQFWGGVALAALIGAPSVIWQAVNGWPFLELLHNDAAAKNVVMPPLEFIAAQLFMINPVAAPLWVAGIAELLFERRLAPLRFLGVAFVLLLAVFMLLPTRDYYLSPIYAMQMSVGAVWVERKVQSAAGQAAIFAALAVTGIAIAPFASAVLPPEKFVAYERAVADTLHLSAPLEQSNAVDALPQHYADQFGWQQLARTVGEVYHRLPVELAPRTAIIAENYGEAGAIDVLGGGYGLPRALSGQNNYYLWGTHGYDGSSAIVVGYSRERLARYWKNVRLAARYEADYIMPYERHRPIWVVSGNRLPLARFWISFRHYD